MQTTMRTMRTSNNSQQLARGARVVLTLGTFWVFLFAASALAAEPVRMKIAVQSEGLYRLPSSQIASCLGVSQAMVEQWIASGDIAMSGTGQNVAWTPSAGGNDVLFYAESIDSIYTRDNIYWLDGGVTGAKMAQIPGGTPPPAGSTLTFRETRTFQESNWAVPTGFHGSTDDIWMWSYAIAGDASLGRLSFPANLPGASIDGNAEIQVRLLGITDTAANPEHHARVYVNGTMVGETTWNGVDAATVSAVFAQSLLTDGENTVEVEAVLDAGVGYSYFYIDEFDISYNRNHRAVNDTLIVHDDANATVAVDGFTTDEIMVLDVTDPHAAAILQGVTQHGAAGNYAVSFDVADSAHRYVAVSPSAAATPATASADTTPDLTAASNAANYVIITPASMLSNSQALADYRAGQGLSTKVIDIDDIYDAFNAGIKDAWAIQSFLAHAVDTWQTAPAYIVLVGEGSYDFMNFKGNGDCLIPSAFVNTARGLCLSDTRLCDIDGDGAPEAAIGRLPVMNGTEFDAIVAKIKAYEQGGDWKSSVLMMADNPDESGDYTALSDSAAALLPGDVSVEKLYLAQQSVTSIRSGLVSAVNEGRALVNYVGHGFINQLANEGLMRATEVNQMANADRAPIILAMACDFGIFSVPGSDFLSEELITRANGGACGVWACTGEAYSDDNQIINEAFLSHVYSSDFARVGDGMVAGLTKHRDIGYTHFMRYIVNYMGDPATIIVGNPQVATIPYDFGDAPSTIYPTSDLDDGARHVVVVGCHLGVEVDIETNACAAGAASGDDLDNDDDEDGVVFRSGIVPGSMTLVDVTASMPGILSAWVDFNGDGDWNDAGEAIFVNQPLSEGLNALQFTVPATIVRAVTYARFRFSTVGDLGPTGIAPDGEVEDYAVEPTPTYAVIGDVAAFERDGQSIVQWNTAIEIGTIGFLVERLDADGIYHRITAELIPSVEGGPYEIIDAGITVGETASYRFIEIENDGDMNVLGPYELTVASAFEVWQQSHFTSDEVANIGTPDADADGDGHSNQQEFLTGTDPRDMASVLRLTGLRSTQAGVELTWKSFSGKAYLIEYASSVDGEFAEVAQISADGATTSYIHEVNIAGSGFYRVSLSL